MQIFTLYLIFIVSIVLLTKDSTEAASAFVSYFKIHRNSDFDPSYRNSNLIANYTTTKSKCIQMCNRVFECIAFTFSSLNRTINGVCLLYNYTKMMSISTVPSVDLYIKNSK